ncbi:Chase2 sensor protein [Lysobacter dokdonensis DS-58]|uniref:Chase2 sensor protein n=1 Tax=Lysobacter dokdonensis DS-58 TaxID=1300345 RepID=A0A0A2X673_9GAMM|nr:CHASE2 domain-containing protein [Lysobacter dokdonensis]KGQ20704.1 Chase2 sensor protein [Lysobacter dokdonensis DS-58]
MARRKRRSRTLLGVIDAAMATLAQRFIDTWGRLERGYKRPLAWLALRVKFVFYPLLALGAVAWLVYDWTGARSLDAAENAVFDKVIKSRPIEPQPSKRVVKIEIDDCSIEHFVRKGEGGWPWSRQRHADLLDALDRAGVKAVGYDVMFADASPDDPGGDMTLEAMAEGGAGRFVFGASRLHSDYDVSEGAIPASQAPGAFALKRNPAKPGPKVALLLPFGEQMRAHAGLVDVTRGVDGMLRDMPLRETAGDWGIPSLALRLAAYDSGRPMASYPASVRINWRSDSRLAFASAADLIEDKPICRDAKRALPPLENAIAVVGYTASGLNDTKPTPVDLEMPGVELHAEAVAALVDGSAIWLPPASLKYILAAILVVLTAFAFWRGEPASDIDSIFVATNLLLLVLAYAGLTFFGAFFDIYASIGFVSLCFGLCRTYAAIQRGRAVGNEDFLPRFEPDKHRWLVFARLRFATYPSLDDRAAARRRREYRRRLRRFLYAGSDAVMLEGVVERKSWLHETLDDLMVLVWKGATREEATARARHDLGRWHDHLNAHDDRLDDDGTVKVCMVASEVDDDLDDSDRGERLRLREALGNALDRQQEWPLSRENPFMQSDALQAGVAACNPDSHID